MHKASGRAYATLAVTAALAALGGCGEDGDEEQIRAVVADVQAAFGDGRVDDACELLTPAAQRHVESIGHGSTGICARDMRGFLRGVRSSPGYVARRPPPEIERIVIDGDVATVSMDLGGGRALTVPFKRQGDAWKVNALYGGIPAQRQKDDI